MKARTNGLRSHPEATAVHKERRTYGRRATANLNKLPEFRTERDVGDICDPITRTVLGILQVLGLVVSTAR